MQVTFTLILSLLRFRQEINVLTDPETRRSPANFGWPCWEGSQRNQAYQTIAA
jgi:hypothetical protein